MEILILEYSSGNLIRVKLDDELEKIFNEDADDFMEMLSDKYQFRMSDIYWMTTNKEDEIHDLAEELDNEGTSLRICDHCGKLMREGYVLGGSHACSDECAIALYDGDEKQLREDLSHADEDDSECYYTEWESYII